MIAREGYLNRWTGTGSASRIRQAKIVASASYPSTRARGIESRVNKEKGRAVSHALLASDLHFGLYINLYNTSSTATQPLQLASAMTTASMAATTTGMSTTAAARV